MSGVRTTEGRSTTQENAENENSVCRPQIGKRPKKLQTSQLAVLIHLVIPQVLNNIRIALLMSYDSIYTDNIISEQRKRNYYNRKI